MGSVGNIIVVVIGILGLSRPVPTVESGQHAFCETLLERFGCGFVCCSSACGLEGGVNICTTVVFVGVVRLAALFLWFALVGLARSAGQLFD